MPRVRITNRLIQLHALAGICGQGDPECCCRKLAFTRIPLFLSLDSKSATRAGNDTFALNVGLGISEGHAWPEETYT